MFFPSNDIYCHSECLGNVYWILFSATALKPTTLIGTKPSHWQSCTLHSHSTHAQKTLRTQKAAVATENFCLCMHSYADSDSQTHKNCVQETSAIMWPEGIQMLPPMNIKYKHSSKFSTPGPYFMPLSWNNKHISFSLPISAPKMNLSPLHKIISQHYMCYWIIHEGSWRVSASSESQRKCSWQISRFSSVGAALTKESIRFTEKCFL